MAGRFVCRMRTPMLRTLARAGLLMAWLAGGLAQAQNPGQPLDAAVDEQQRIDREAQASQQKIDALDDETRRLLADYRHLTRETDSLQRYNAQLERQIASQRREMGSIRDQLESINDVSRDVVPLMLRMIATLEKFIALDLPFLREERRLRVAALKEIMDRADVSTSEKYRRVVEAYQVEMEYARTIEAYQAELALADDARTVNVLRIGRIALLYQTLDGEETGFYNVASGTWEGLGSGYQAPVRKALRIARKQAAPDLLVVPVAAPDEL